MKTAFQYIFFLLAFFTMPLFWGCAPKPLGPTYVKEGKEYGQTRGAFFRHRWWNYYERGRSFAEGEFYPEALADLNEAVQQRAKDQRMARTYGMHFVDYFPHRELGIIHYQMGNFQAAREELELSLSQYPSAKARFYLDHVRRALIEQEAREVSPPKLSLDFETEEVWTREDPVVLSGVAEDEAYVAGITINGVSLFQEGSEKRIHFQRELRLFQGRHHVAVEARNLIGKVSKQRVLIHVDREGPVIILDDLRVDLESPEREVVVGGLVYDASDVSELIINSEVIPIRKTVEVSFTHKLVSGATVLEIVAHDRLGNSTSADIPLTSAYVRNGPLLLAWVSPDGSAPLSLALFGREDNAPPRITLKGWTDAQTVFIEKVYLEGMISDESKVASLSINEIPVTLRRKGRIVFFSHFAELVEGENTIVFEARDEGGNRTTRKISVTRQVPKALQLAERLSLTVLPFGQKGEISDSSLSFQDNLINSLVNQNRFRVVERDKLEVILAEQKLSRSRLIDRGTALRLGQMVAAQSIITGSIIETRTGVEIVARMIDTETSEVLAAEDVYDEAKDLPALRALAEGMAVKFHREFPLVDGVVIQKEGRHIFTDLGREEIKPRRRIIVYRERAIRHPVTEKLLGADNEIIGRARVTQVMPEISKAELVIGEARSIKPMDKVLTE